tara:strand:- start:1154 stop:1660 length:507 start_codon:yes stop_codon:yes gene_type:complete
MTGSGDKGKVTPHVTLSKGSNRKHQVGGSDNSEGVAMLVADSGRSNFAAPLHPVLQVTTTATSLNDLVKAQYANLTAAARTALGLYDADGVPSITANRGFLLKALATNGNEIFVGTSHVSAADITGAFAAAVGFQLEAGASIFIEITDASNIYLDATDSDESLCWLAL